MPKKPKCDVDDHKDTWSEDQKDHEYYYDDAHGYEEYRPEEDRDGELLPSDDRDRDKGV